MLINCVTYWQSTRTSLKCFINCTKNTTLESYLFFEHFRGAWHDENRRNCIWVYDFLKCDVTWEWRKPNNEELNDLYFSPNIILVSKPRRMRWARHVERVVEKNVCLGFWWGNLWERDLLEDTEVVGSIILQWVIRKWDGGMNWIELAQDRDRWRALVKVVMNFRVT